MTVKELAKELGIHPTNVQRRLGRLGVRLRYPDPVPPNLEARVRSGRVVEPGPRVIAVSPSNNRKLGRAASTTAPRQTCPATCPLKGQGCYPEHDNTRVWWDRITSRAEGATPEELAREEADLIDKLPANRDLRVHVAGDCPTEGAARIVGAAVKRYVYRGKRSTRRHKGEPVRAWAYTHSWRTIPRSAWTFTLAVLASCETAADVKEADRRNYATCITVPEFEAETAYTKDGVRIIPCPNQTRGVACTDCRLCFDDDRLQLNGLTIGFAVHGAGKNKAKAALARIPLN